MRTVRAAQDRFTVQDYAALPEGFPAQLIDGFLVKETPLYGHQRTASLIHFRLSSLLHPCRVLPSPAGVTIDEFNVFHPDVAVYDAPPPVDERRTVVPTLVVEVLSPSTRRRDREVKCRRYLRVGVEEVWLVDAAEGVVEVHSHDAVRSARGADPVASRVVPGFELRASELPR
jgi:Uma2 family endonuclease